MDKKFLSTAETAEKWGISERSVRNYCNDGRVDGAVLIGIDRENAALAALILACENVNGIALFNMKFAHWVLICLRGLA